MTSEEWRPIPGFDGYEVSDLGRVRSWRVPGRGSPAKRRSTPLVLAPSVRPGRYGYRYVVLGGRTSKQVHHLVAETFIGPRPAGQVVRHLNDDRFDNRPSNIAYGTRRDNFDDAVRNGRLKRAEHGTASRYQTGCRCDACRIARNVYQREYRARRAAA